MPTIDIQGVRHAYDLTPPTASTSVLVFLHGWLLSRGYWQPLIEKLAPTYQCLAYDLRGFGDSQIDRNSTASASHAAANPISELLAPASPSLSESRYTPAAYARDLGILLQQLNISQAWLIGHSLGGSIALWAAAQFPQSIRGTICMNSGGGIYLKEEFERFRTAGRQLLKVRPRWLCHLPWLDLLFCRAAVVRPIQRCWGRQRVIDFVTADAEAALGALLDSTTEFEVNSLPQVVSQIQQPVYFMAGDRDTIMEPKYVRHLASFHHLFGEYGDNAIEIPNCGHLAMIEQTDVVADTICMLLDRHLFQNSDEI